MKPGPGELIVRGLGAGHTETLLEVLEPAELERVEAAGRLVRMPAELAAAALERLHRTPARDRGHANVRGTVRRRLSDALEAHR